MKAKLTAGLFTSRTDEWGTPQTVFDALNKEFHFDLDAAAQADNAKCEKFFSDALFEDWTQYKSVFVNPPYSQNKQFLKKAFESGKKTTVVVLCPCRTDTIWFHEYAMQAKEIRFVKGRLKYNDGKQTAPFPTCVIVFKPSALQVEKKLISTCFKPV